MTIQDFNTALAERNAEPIRVLARLQEPRLLETLEASIEPGGWLEWA